MKYFPAFRKKNLSGIVCKAIYFRISIHCTVFCETNGNIYELLLTIKDSSDTTDEDPGCSWNFWKCELVEQSDLIKHQIRGFKIKAFKHISKKLILEQSTHGVELTNWI